MARILFRMLPQTGHHNATYPLAKALKEAGHIVIYAANIKFRSSVEENGFQFCEIAEKDDILVFNTVNEKKPGLWTFIASLIHQRTLRRRYRQKIIQQDFFSEIIAEVNPDIILIDIFLGSFALDILRHKIPFFTVQILVSTIRMYNKPPLDSSYIPTPKKHSRFIVWLHWQLYYLKTLPIPSSVRGVSILAKRVGFPIDQVAFGNYSTIGFKSIPEINTSPFEFDFPHTKASNHFYFRPQQIFERADMLTDYAFKEEYEEIKRSTLPIVFCSFGSLSWRYAGAADFFRKLVYLFSNDLQYVLIVCIEDDLLRRELRKVRNSRIYIYKRVPQVDLLKNAVDIMINHGGINSITECIFTETPMLVYPGNNAFDQVGNAARVHHHKIGLRGTYRESLKTTKNKIQSLVEDGIYKNNIIKMKRAIEQSEAYSDINSLINKYVQTNVHS